MGEDVARLELEDNIAVARKAKAGVRNFQANLGNFYDRLEDIRVNIANGYEE